MKKVTQILAAGLLLISVGVFADNDKDESGNGWKDQKEQSREMRKRDKERWKKEREYGREARKRHAEEEREYEKDRRRDREKITARTQKTVTSINHIR